MAYNEKRSFPLSKRNLNDYDVLFVDDYNNPRFFDVKIDFDSLSYGKNYISIAAIDGDIAPYTLKLSSHVQIEVKDSENNVIFHELIYTPYYSFYASFYIRVDEDLFNTYKILEDGKNTINLTILGELTDKDQQVPEEWIGIYNVKMNIPLTINRNQKNTSKLYFNKLPKIKINEYVQEDTDQNIYNRSYADILIDDLHTVGGMVEFGEVSFLSDKSRTDDNQILNTFQIQQNVNGLETLRKEITNAGITGLDDSFNIGPGSGSDWIGDFKNAKQYFNWRRRSRQFPVANQIFPAFLSGFITVTPNTSLAYSLDGFISLMLKS